MSAPLVPPLPRELQLEVTSACNLRCAMCLVRYRPPVNKADGAMDLNLFYRLLDEVPGVQRLTLQGLGEPLLHPGLLDMIVAGRARGARVGFNSNGTLLTADAAQRLVEAGLDWLHVSLDGATAATYEAIRERARLRTVLRNIEGLVHAKRWAGSTTPHTRLVFVAMRRNVSELPVLVRLAGSLGVDEVRVQNLSHDFADTDPNGSYQEIGEYARSEALSPDDDLVASAFAQARVEADRTGVTVRLPELVARSHPPTTPGCTWPWDSAYITSSGVVQPCCMVMGDDRVALGRLAEQSFADIWAGPAYVDFRRRLLGGQPPDVCRGCSLYRGTF